MKPAFKAQARANQSLRAPPADAQTSGPQWRLFFAVAFCAIQLIKLATGRSFQTWATLDLGFLSVLYLSKTPWLQFSLRVYLVGLLALLTIDAILIKPALLSYPWLALTTLMGRQLTVTGSRERPIAQQKLAREHLQGKYTIDYVPEAYASLQADESLCLGDSELPVYFHLIVNNTKPAKVRLAGQTFEGDLFYKEFGSRELTRVLSSKQDSLTHFFLPVDAAASYKLFEVADASGSSVKTRGEMIVVPPCPAAAFAPLASSRVCTGSSVKAEVEVSGLAPFTLSLDDGTSLQIGQTEQELVLQKIAVPISFATETAGRKTIKVASVKDALGNLANVDAEASIDVIVPPSVEIQGATEVPLLGDSVTISLLAGDDLPSTLEYNDPEGREHTAVLTSSSAKLELSQPGTYILTKFKGSLCSTGTIKGPKALKVFVPPPVSASVEFEQLKDKCSGPTGIHADVALEGTPPFTLYYETLKNGRVVERDTTETRDKTAQVLFKPRSVGTFTYRFTKVRDAYRSELLEFETEQVIEEIAGASFASNVRTTYCPSEPVTVGVQVQGKGPLTLNFAVDGRKRSLEGVSDRVLVELGALNGGDHELLLQSVTDVNGCTTPLDVRSPKIHVRKDKASAKFKGPSKLKVYDANMVLPLQTSGKGPLNVVYSVNGTNHTQKVVDSLRIHGPGTYQLLDLNDGCPGAVGSEAVEVTLYERPSLSVLEQEPEVCADTFSNLVLGLKGEPPFKVWSEHVDPHGKSSFEEHSTYNHKLKLSTKPRELAGLYRSYYWITDKLYPDSERSLGALIVEQRVLGAPVLMHERPGVAYELCQSPTSPQGVPIIVQGAAPFEVRYQLVDEASGKTTLHKTVVPHVGRYELVHEFSGTAQLRLTTVKDSRGCTGHAVANKASVTVKSVVAPELTIQTRDVCVGSHVHLGMRGVAPFTLAYTLNNKRHTVRPGERFSFLATKPGTMHISRLEDSQKCPAQLNETITIHDLPSSRITRQPVFRMHKGDDAVELQFAFDGTPPFTFEYTRSVEGREVERHKVEGAGHEHSVFAQEQGEYQVVSLEDAHCRVAL